MIKDGTTFILGAGFSREVSMPLGKDLKTGIIEQLRLQAGGEWDDVVRPALFLPGRAQEREGTTRELVAALGGAASIDNLVEHRSELVDCAKLGICAAILKAEKKASIHLTDEKFFERCSPSAFVALFYLLVGNVPKGQVADALARTRFIIFNYDRCWEHFLTTALIKYSGFSPAEAARIVAKIPIWHPYGQVGRLSDYSELEMPVRPFGSIPDHLELLGLADQIKTFSEERTEGQNDLSQMRHVMRHAPQIIFLGCAFHEQNLKLLDHLPSHSSVQIYATCYMPPPADPDGQSVPNLASFTRPTADAFKSRTSRWLGEGQESGFSIHVDPFTCLQFVTKHGVSWLAN